MKYKVAPLNAEMHSDDVYTPEMHQKNQELSRAILGLHGIENTTETPWLIGHLGLVAVEQTKNDTYKLRVIETRKEGFYSLKEHFWDGRVTLGDQHVKAVTKIWPPFHQRMSLRVNIPISGGMMMGYPVLEESAPGICEKIEETLSDPTLEPVRQHDLKGLYAERPFELRHRLGVRL